MSEDDATKLLKSLLQKDAIQVQAWLKTIWTGKEHISNNFNWHGLAEVAASRASDNLNLEWAKVAIYVYNFLAANQPNATGKESFMSSAMTLRAYMISKLGATPGDEILDIEYLVNWFFNDLKISDKDALIKADAWKKMLASKNKKDIQNKLDAELEEFRILRQIKSRLTLFKLLSESNKFTPDKEIADWLSIQDKLP